MIQDEESTEGKETNVVTTVGKKNDSPVNQESNGGSIESKKTAVQEEGNEESKVAEYVENVKSDEVLPL